MKELLGSVVSVRAGDNEESNKDEQISIVAGLGG
jgi:hypothetical protein